MGQKEGASSSFRSLTFSILLSEARRKATAARAEAQRLADIERQNQQRMKEQERRRQEEVRQMELNRARMREEQQREAQRRLQVFSSRVISGLSAPLLPLHCPTTVRVRGSNVVTQSQESGAILPGVPL